MASRKQLTSTGYLFSCQVGGGSWTSTDLSPSGQPPRGRSQAAAHRPATRGRILLRLTPALLVGPDKMQWVALVPLHPPGTSPPCTSRGPPSGWWLQYCWPDKPLSDHRGLIWESAPAPTLERGRAVRWQRRSAPPPFLTLQAYPARVIQPLSSIRESRLFIQRTPVCSEVACARTCRGYLGGSSEWTDAAPVV